ncbi:MAG: cation transporter [Saprospiraceae bacterium]|nr:cation transporter [Saprospiraceae bacterium]
MKNIIILVSFLFTALAVNAQMDQFTLRVDGLGCPFCAYGLEKKFKDVKGIKDIKIDIQTGKMTFNVPVATMLTLEQADDRVNKAGYTAKAISVLRADGKKESIGDTEVSIAPKDMNAGGTKKSFKVSGNCEMCKARIDKAAKSVKGVTKADWNVDTKILSVEFDDQKTKLVDIQKAIAKVGHDNAGAKADGKVYDKLPACCQYKRS